MTISSSAVLAGGDLGSQLAARPLEAAAFAGFGEVLSLSGSGAVSVNQGRGERRDLPRPAGQPGLRETAALYDLSPSSLPFDVTLVERHPLTAQLFVPLDVARWLVLVMPQRPDGSPDPAGARAFLAGSDHAVIYAPGVWHLPLVALDRPGRFLMRMWEAGTAEDCREARLDAPLRVLA